MYCQEYIFIFIFTTRWENSYLSKKKTSRDMTSLGMRKKRWWMEFDKDIFLLNKKKLTEGHTIHISNWNASQLVIQHFL